MIAVLAMAGCGSDDGSTGSPSPAADVDTAPATLDHDELVAELNSICASGNSKLGKLNAEFKAATSEAVAIDILEQSLAIYSDALERIDNLDPPAADSAAFDRYVTASGRTEAAMRRLVAAGQAGESGEIAALSDALDAETDRRLTAALDLGADECGRSLTR
jgi:hypothetical protein